MRIAFGDLDQFLVVHELDLGGPEGDHRMFQTGQNEAVKIDEISRHMHGGDDPFVRAARKLMRAGRHALQHHAAAFGDPVDGDNDLTGAKADMLRLQRPKPLQILFADLITPLKIADEIFGNSHSAPRILSRRDSCKSFCPVQWAPRNN